MSHAQVRRLVDVINSAKEQLQKIAMGSIDGDTLGLIEGALGQLGRVVTDVRSPRQLSPKMLGVPHAGSPGQGSVFNDLNTIPMAEEKGGATPEVEGGLKPLGRKKRSIVFLDKESPSEKPLDETITPQAACIDKDENVGKWLSHTYSGFGSFRAQSRANAAALNSSPGGNPRILPHSLSFQDENVMPDLDLSREGARKQFSRPHTRHTAVFHPAEHLIDEVGEFVPEDELPILDLINQVCEMEFDVYRIPCGRLELDELEGDDSFTEGHTRVDEEGSHFLSDPKQIFMSVACSVILRYSFVITYQMNMRKFYTFLETIYAFYSRGNPFSNALHAVDTLQRLHFFFCNTKIKENFSDVELCAALFAALCIDVGHIGVNNEFLSRSNHMYSILFTDASPMEHASALISIMFLFRIPQTAFFADSETWKRGVNEDDDPGLNELVFREVFNEIILGSAAQHHEVLLLEVQRVMSQTAIVETDIPKLLKALVHAADYSFVLMNHEQFVHRAKLYVEEMVRQGDAERARGYPVQLLGRREDAAELGTYLAAFARYVVAPFVEEMSEFLPQVCVEFIPRNVAWLEDKEVATRLLRPVLEKEIEPWSDNSELLLPVLDDLIKRQQPGHSIESSSSHHYFALLKLFSSAVMSGGTSSTTTTTRDPEGGEEQVVEIPFAARLVALALHTDKNLVGKYAIDAINDGDVKKMKDEDFAMIANLIVDTEILPSTVEVFATPKKSRSSNLSDPFLLQLLTVWQKIEQERAAKAEMVPLGTGSLVYVSPQRVRRRASSGAQQPAPVVAGSGTKAALALSPKAIDEQENGAPDDSAHSSRLSSAYLRSHQLDRHNSGSKRWCPSVITQGVYKNVAEEQ